MDTLLAWISGRSITRMCSWKAGRGHCGTDDRQGFARSRSRIRGGGVSKSPDWIRLLEVWVSTWEDE